jgi:indolepyruvate ferredoxin oxidoreductase
LVRLARTRIADLISYQNEAYAERFARVVETFAAAAQTIHAAPECEMTELVVRNLHKIMSYKDEYEVARLLTDRVFAERVKALFPGFEGMAYNLQPPFARTFGLSRKVEMGTWFDIPLRLLACLRRVRGSAFDPFLMSKVRREERDLVDWYINVVYRCSQSLSLSNMEAIIDLLNLPESIRGYEHLKLESSTAARKKATRLLSMLQPTTPSLVLLT